MRSTNLDITPQAREKTKKQFTTLRGEWTKRKRWCAEAIGNLADSCDKKPADMAKVIGVETDEDAGATLPPVLGAAVSGGASTISKKRPFVLLGAGKKKGSAVGGLKLERTKKGN